MPLSRKDVLARARYAIWAEETIYKLGKGGFDPDDPTPGNKRQECDCSGFVAWTLGISRHFPAIDGQWIETSIVYRDATKTKCHFEEVEVSRPGDIIVYPDKDKRQGHIGVVSEVNDLGKVMKVIHCSSGNFRAYGSAIKETVADIFYLRGAVVARYKGLVD